ncbi:MAG: hypothetical protein MJA83_02095, partial [Gammaproteobacteria bacterium]|nr:hypothetical protein [Gammaproteobacteria bacterium]
MNTLLFAFLEKQHHRVMYALAQAFFDLSMLKIGPQQLPASSFLLRLTALAFVLVTLIASRIQFADWWLVLQLTGFEVAFLALFSWAVLSLAQQLNRFLQTVTALFGASAVVGFVSLPIL